MRGKPAEEETGPWDALQVWSFDGWKSWQKRQREAVGVRLIREELPQNIGEKLNSIFTTAGGWVCVWVCVCVCVFVCLCVCV